MCVTNRVGEIKAMNDNDFKAFINDESWELNKKTIEAMMEKELEKDVQEINVDFVDACMNYLAGYSIVNTPQGKGKVINKNKKKRIKFSRIIIAAILVVCSISIGMTVYAKANDMRISDIFVDIFDNKAVIKYSDKDLLQKYSNNLNGNKLYDALEAEGIENIMLPFDLYYTPYKIIENEVKRPSNADEIANIICSHFIKESANETYQRSTGIAIHSNGSIYLYNDTFKEYTIDQFKTWLSNNPITVEYELAEEEIETAETRKEENYESRQQPRFCCMCGAKLVPGQRFCQCGARILLNAVEVNPDDANGEKKNLFYYLERFISYHL